MWQNVEHPIERLNHDRQSSLKVGGERGAIVFVGESF